MTISWGATSLASAFPKKEGGNFVNKDEKYLTLKTPGIGQDAHYEIRFLGDVTKFYTHWVQENGKRCRKICLKTVLLRKNDGSPVFFKTLPDGSKAPYTPEDVMDKCPYCLRGDNEARPRYASNVIDIQEMARLRAEGKPPIVRLMEFPTTVFNYIHYFLDTEKIIPSDLEKGPIFDIYLEYERKPKITAQDIKYRTKERKIGGCPISQESWNVLQGKMHNLLNEFNPFRPGIQNPLGIMPEPKNDNNNSQSYAQASTSFQPSITGAPAVESAPTLNSATPVFMPDVQNVAQVTTVAQPIQPIQPVQPVQQAQYVQQPVQPAQPVQQPTPDFSFGSQAPQMPQAQSIPAVEIQVQQDSSPVAPNPQNLEVSASEIEDIFGSLGPSN